MPITELRSKIDKIDVKILRLIEERVEVTKKIGEAKRKHNLPIEDKGREDKIHRRLISKTHLNKKLIRKIFTTMIDYCKDNE